MSTPTVRPEVFDVLPVPVVQAIASERIHQELRWPGHRHTIGEWVLILDKLNDDLKRSWLETPERSNGALNVYDEARQKCANGNTPKYPNGYGNEAVLHELRQIATTALVAMEQCGAPKRIIEPTAPGALDRKPVTTYAPASEESTARLEEIARKCASSVGFEELVKTSQAQDAPAGLSGMVARLEAEEKYLYDRYVSARKFATIDDETETCDTWLRAVGTLIELNRRRGVVVGPVMTATAQEHIPIGTAVKMAH